MAFPKVIRQMNSAILVSNFWVTRGLLISKSRLVTMINLLEQEMRFSPSLHTEVELKPLGKYQCGFSHPP